MSNRGGSSVGSEGSRLVETLPASFLQAGRGMSFFWQPGGQRSRCLTFLFVLHPVANEIRAGEEAKMAAFAAYQIHERHAIQFLQMSQVEQGPQGAFNRGRNKLIEVGQMTLRQ